MENPILRGRPGPGQGLRKLRRTRLSKTSPSTLESRSDPRVDFHVIAYRLARSLATAFLPSTSDIEERG
jgi:hypothetical protein